MVPEPAACPGLSTPAEEERAAGLSDRFLDILCTCTSPRGLHAGMSSNHILHLKLRGPPTHIITRKSGFAAQILKPENSGKIILISGSCTKEKKRLSMKRKTKEMLKTSRCCISEPSSFTEELYKEPATCTRSGCKGVKRGNQPEAVIRGMGHTQGSERSQLQLFCAGTHHICARGVDKNHQKSPPQAQTGSGLLLQCLWLLPGEVIPRKT